MVLESVVGPKVAQRYPITIVALAIVFVSLGVFTAGWIAKGSESFLLVSLVALPSIPFLLKLFERDEMWIHKAGRLLGSRTLMRYSPLIIVLGAYFVGLIAGFALWYSVLPEETNSQLFGAQVEELRAIRGQFAGAVAGAATAVANAPSGLKDAAGHAVQGMDSGAAFELIFFNNLRVLALILVFSVLYGAGSFLILIWNASVLGVFIASATQQAAKVASSEPFVGTLSGLAYAVAGIAPHGGFEMLSYLTAALAGGIMSAATARRAWRDERFVLVIHDIAKLVAWSVLFLSLGAVVESGVLG
jgi:uncharacterized membrane protein SpoIIM required for sporulation